MAIDRWHDDDAVIAFDDNYGIEFPSASGAEGGGGGVFYNYDIPGTPNIVIIAPDREILKKQLYPPSTQNLTDTLLVYGGILKECSNGITESLLFNEFLVYPNPAQSILNIEFNIIDRQNLIFEISGLLGQQLYISNERSYQFGTAALTIDVSNFEKGFYLLNVYADGKYINSEKLIIDN